MTALCNHCNEPLPRSPDYNPEQPHLGLLQCPKHKTAGCWFACQHKIDVRACNNCEIGAEE